MSPVLIGCIIVGYVLIVLTILIVQLVQAGRIALAGFILVVVGMIVVSVAGSQVQKTLEPVLPDEEFSWFQREFIPGLDLLLSIRDSSYIFKYWKHIKYFVIIEILGFLTALAGMIALIVGLAIKMFRIG